MKKRKKNRHGLITLRSLTNSVVPMRELELSKAVPSKDGDYDALPSFNAKVSWGQSWELFKFTPVMFGKEHPIEKA